MGYVYLFYQLTRVVPEKGACDVTCQSWGSPGQRDDQDIANDWRVAASEVGHKVLRACKVESDEYYEYEY